MTRTQIPRFLFFFPSLFFFSSNFGAISVHVLCTPYNHAPVYSVTTAEATCGQCIYMRLAVKCHLHFWQYDGDLSHATAVTPGGNRYRNKSRNKKLTLEKSILPPLLPGFEPETFQPQVWCSALSYPPNPKTGPQFVQIQLAIKRNAHIHARSLA